MTKQFYRYLALLSVILWVAAWALPQTSVAHFALLDFRFQPYTPLPADGFSQPQMGSRLAAWGWGGPIMLAFGWYANIPWLICVQRLARLERPNPLFAVATAALSLSVLLPYHHMEWAGAYGSWFWLSGPAVWSWLLAMLIAVVASLGKGRANRPSTTSA